MTPPLDICHTLLATIFKAIYDNSEANRSIIAGNSRSKTGAYFFANPYDYFCSLFLIDIR